MSLYAPLLVGLVALLAGLAIGKAWERYKLRDGQWIDRRKARESPHFIVGLDLVVANQIDRAIDELSRAAWLDEDALEIHLVLGNLYREKGQVGRAINIHQSLLQRPRLKPLEHAYILLCLGLDYRRGGFVDRAYEAFKEVLRLDPRNRHALMQLEKLHEEQHQWAEAYDARNQLAEIEGPPRKARHEAILAFLENELGEDALRQGNRAEAIKRFDAAIERDRTAAPAYLHLGDVYALEENLPKAIETWETLVELVPDRAYLAFDRLQTASNRIGTPQRFVDLCRRIVATNNQDWRARLALARHRSAVGDAARRRGAPVRGAHSQPARAGDPPGDLEGVLDTGTAAAAHRTVSDAHEGRRLLSRPARLRALPLPEHRAALAMPAMPRVEHVHRGADRAGERRRTVERVSALD